MCMKCQSSPPFSAKSVIEFTILTFTFAWDILTNIIKANVSLNFFIHQLIIPIIEYICVGIGCQGIENYIGYLSSQKNANRIGAEN